MFRRDQHDDHLLPPNVGRLVHSRIGDAVAIYNVKIDVTAAAPERWKSICTNCARFGRLTRRAPAGQAIEERHGAHPPRGRWAVPSAAQDHDVLLLSKTGRACVSTWRRRSTASARGSTTILISCSRCTASIAMTWSRLSVPTCRSLARQWRARSPCGVPSRRFQQQLDRGEWRCRTGSATRAMAALPRWRIH